MPPAEPPAEPPPLRLAFDRGTLLLLDVPADVAGDLPGVVWDPRVGAWRAPAYRLRELRRALAERGLPGGRPTARPAATGPWHRVELRDYQAGAVSAWEQAGRRGTVVLPTGAGKTRVAVAAMARSRLPALCLVPTRVLLEQWERRLGGALAAPVGVLGDRRREIELVTVATAESAWRHMDRIGGRFGLLVIDEVHHFGRGRRDEALEMCAAPCRLGLTATPPADEVAVARLEELVGPVIYRLAVDDLAGTFLAGYEQVTVWCELSAAEREEYEREMGLFRSVFAAYRIRRGPDAFADFLREARRSDTARRALASWRRARAITAYPESKRRTLARLLSRHHDRRVLVFTPDNATAYAIARQHLVMPVTCEIGRRERQEVLGRFARGELGALVSSRVLNEGVDVPAADVGIVVGGTLGEREHVQRVGRLLRPAEGKRAVVYELVVRATGEVRAAWQRRLGLAAG